jgi:hypothetical protein
MKVFLALPQYSLQLATTASSFTRKKAQYASFFLIMGSLSVAARSQSSIVGTVTDPTGAVIPDARITAVQPATAAVREARTDRSGRFQISNLPIGTYTLRSERQGFRPTEQQELSLSIHQTLETHLSMSIAAAEQTVEVSSQPEALETTAVNTSVTLGGERIDDTPLQKRNFLNFVLLAPGVASASHSNTLRASAALRSPDEDSGFSFGGLRARNNGLYIDSLDNRDELSGGNRIAVSPDMVDQFQVAGSDIAPASGGAAGANVNVVTKSGSNRWHGDSSFRLGNEFANARDPDVEAKTKPIYRTYNPEASLGGPIRKDRTFFYATVEQEWENSQDASEVPDGSVLKQLNATLSSPGLARAATHNLSDALFSTGSSSTMFFVKLDQQLNPANTVLVRYAFSRGTEANDVLGTSNFNDQSSRGSSLVQDQSFAAGWTSAPSGTFSNQLRAQYAHRKVVFTPNSSGALIEIPGVVSFGQSTQLNGTTAQNYVQGVEALTFSRGNHLLSVGVNGKYVGFDNQLQNRFAGVYIFPDATAFTQSMPDTFLQRFADPHTQYSTEPIGVWVQDQWQAGHGLTFVGGVRYDAQRLPSPIPSATNNWSPRLGVAWHPGKSPWVLRASYGLFYDSYPFSFLNDAIQVDGVHGFEQYAVGSVAAQAFVAAQGGTLTTPLVGVAHSIYRPAGNFPSTYARHITVGAERSLGSTTTVTAEYLNVHGYHLPRTRNSSMTLPPLYQLEQTASSSYQGGTVAINHRFTHEVAFLLSYTESRAYDDASDFNQQPLDPSNTRLDWARSDQYQARRVAASGVFELPFGDDLNAPIWLRRAAHDLDLGPVLSYGSPRPINALQTTDAYRTGAYPVSARPAGIGRNAFFDRDSFDLDLRLSKGFVLPKERGIFTVGANSFNLTNHTNSLRANPYYSDGTTLLPSFGRLVEGLDARQLQFTLEWEF